MSIAASERKTDDLSQRSLRVHARYRGKIQSMPKVPITGGEDFAIYYTPGVAEPCRAIEHSTELVYEYTNKCNSVAIVTDGSRVLGLGDIGPEAGLPVMEGKALLFKYLGGVDAVPLCLATHDPDRIIETVQYLQPAFGGINLEDIAQPKCFAVLDALEDSLGIPVWHDDQQGTATATLAGLVNALKVVGKELKNVRILLFGMGAANVAVYRVLMSIGVDPRQIVACDEYGLLHKRRHDVEEQQKEFYDLWRVCNDTNPENLTGEPGQAFKGTDICIAFSAPGPDIIKPEWVKMMERDAIMFACANPIPEIWPEDAKAAGARIVATGRSDFENQLNNSLIFPGLFRGVLDAGASAITEEMTYAAAYALAEYGQMKGLTESRILPGMDDWRQAVRVATAAALKAQEQGLNRVAIDPERYPKYAEETIAEARRDVSRVHKTETSGEPSDEFVKER